MFQFLLNKANTVRIENNRITDNEFIVREINRFKFSKRRNDMITGERYYEGKHDILSRKRPVIGANGEL